MAYRKINPLLWDDEWVASLDDFDRTVWFAILTGPQVRNIPGLMIATAATLADFMRRPVDAVAAALSRFALDGKIEQDERARVLRVIKAPRWAAEHGEPENQNVIKGWWRAWKELPESPVKRRHLSGLLDAFSMAKARAVDAPISKQALESNTPENVRAQRAASWDAAWDATFGTVPPPNDAPPPPTKPSGNGSSGLGPDSNNGSETVPEPSGNGLGNPLAYACARQEPEQEQFQEQEPEQDFSRASARATPTPMPPVVVEVQDYDGQGGRGDRVLAILRESPEVAAMSRDGQLDLRGVVRDLLTKASNYVMGGKLREDEVDERIDAIAADLAREVSAAARTAKPMQPRDVARKAHTFSQTTFGKSREEWRSRRPRPASGVQRGGWTREDAERNRPVLAEGDEV